MFAGHPKLKNDLRRPSMEEIGSRATIFELEGLGRVGNPGDTWWSRYRVGINPSFWSLWGPVPQW
jgi:hypothetical protein